MGKGQIAGRHVQYGKRQRESSIDLHDMTAELAGLMRNRTSTGGTGGRNFVRSGQGMANLITSSESCGILRHNLPAILAWDHTVGVGGAHPGQVQRGQGLALCRNDIVVRSRS